jgi:hypothetical protein
MSFILDRLSIRHEKQLFHPKVLMELLDILVNFKVDPSKLSEREKNLAFQGATSDQVRLSPVWYKPWMAELSRLAALFEPYTYVIFPVQVRQMKADSNPVPWHQDSGYQKAMGSRAHSRVVTCFVPLNADASRRATLEFALDVDQQLEHKSNELFRAILEGDEFRRREYYIMERGDALVFGDSVPHRTFVPPGAVLERATIEYRLTRPEDALPDKDYFDLNKGEFVCNHGSSSVVFPS